MALSLSHSASYWLVGFAQRIQLFLMLMFGALAATAQNSPPAVSVEPKSLNIVLLENAPTTMATMEVTGASTSWTASSTEPGLSVTPASGVGNGTLTVAITGTNLPLGNYTNSVTIASEGLAIEVPVTIHVVKMALSKMLADLERPYIYALHPGSGTADDALLIFISTVSGVIEKVLPIGANPTDFSINYFEDRLYVLDAQKNEARVVDLAQRVELPHLTLATDADIINAGELGRLVVEGRDQWIKLLNSTTGAELAELRTFGDGDAEMDPARALYYRGGQLSAGGQLRKYSVTDDTLTFVAITTNNAPGSTNVVLSGDGSRLFWKRHIYNAELREVGVLGEEISAVSTEGRFAIGATKIYDTTTLQAIFGLPVSATISAVSPDGKIFLYDAAKGSVEALDLAMVLNQPPSAGNLVLDSDEDIAVTIRPPASDPESAPLTYTIVSQPAVGIVEATSDHFIFTPPTNFVGTVSFEYVAKDKWHSSGAAVITINVRSINDAPIANASDLVASTERPRYIQLRATDPEDDPLTFAIVRPPQHGALTGEPPFLEYVPAEGFTGVDEFEYAVSDGIAAPVQAAITLTVHEAACAEAPAGIAHWWSGENVLRDEVGGTPLISTNAVEYADGMVGRGFLLSSNSPQLELPGRYIPFRPVGFSVEGWVSATSLPEGATLLEWKNGGELVHAGPRVHIESAGLALTVTTGIFTIAPSPTRQIKTTTIETGALLRTNTFHHFALTFQSDAGRYIVYLDGEPVGQFAKTNLSAQGRGPLSFGGAMHPEDGPEGITGVFDDMTVYSRPLTSTEVQQIFLASSKGKCPIQLPVSFLEGPGEVMIPFNGSLNLQPWHQGSPPISYQWLLNGRPLESETNMILLATNISAASNGVYSLRAENAYGATVSFGTYVTTESGPQLKDPSFEARFDSRFSHISSTPWIIQDLYQPSVPIRAAWRGHKPIADFFSIQPTEGASALVHGFGDSYPGSVRISQDVAIPIRPSTLHFDYRAAWDLRNGAHDRTVQVVIEPEGGGPPLASRTFLSAPAGSYVTDTGAKSGSFDLTQFGGRTVRISFVTDVPQWQQSRGLFQLDNVSVAVEGEPEIESQPRHIVALKGDVAFLKVRAQGTKPMSFQWYKDGQPVSTMTSEREALDVSSDVSGSYTVTVSNALGVAVSKPFTLQSVSEPQMGSPYLEDGILWLPVAAPYSLTLVVETSFDLQNWTALGEPHLIDSSLTTFVAPSAEQQFFRLRLPPTWKPR